MNSSNEIRWLFCTHRSTANASSSVIRYTCACAPRVRFTRNERSDPPTSLSGARVVAHVVIWTGRTGCITAVRPQLLPELNRFAVRYSLWPHGRYTSCPSCPYITTCATTRIYKSTCNFHPPDRRTFSARVMVSRVISARSSGQHFAS